MVSLISAILDEWMIIWAIFGPICCVAMIAYLKAWQNQYLALLNVEREVRRLQRMLDQTFGDRK